jgi:DNA polymerase-3 subunit delta'
MAYFEHLIGNDRIKHYLTQMVEKNAIGNSLLFSGPEGIGKGLFALELTKMLFSREDPTQAASISSKVDAATHPDLHIYRPTGKLGLHSIESMRQFSELVYMAPYSGRWKLFIIHDAERMLPYSANALLKTFEEPTIDSVIILLSSAPESLLPTVLSRCRTVRFRPLTREEVSWKKEEGEERWSSLLKVLAQGRFNSYQELQKFAAEVGETTDQIKAQVEEEARHQLLEGMKENLSAVTQQAIEKEIEGAVSMRYVEEVNLIFNLILGWYRDLHLLLARGESRLLLHPTYREVLEQCVQRGEIPALEEVQKRVTETKLSVQRSSPLSSCLESLFLKLNYL